MKISPLNSDNNLLDSECYSIIHKIIHSHYRREREKIVATIKNIFDEYPNYKGLIVDVLKFDLSEWIDTRKEKLENAGTENNAKIQSINSNINGVQHLLNWLNNGLGEYSESSGVEAPQLSSEMKFEPTLREWALYYIYLDVEVTKEKAGDLLEYSKHTSGAKLKQNYDYYSKTINRVNTDTGRKNNHRLKEFESVIRMLEKTDNITAIDKAKDEHNIFKNKIE